MSDEAGPAPDQRDPSSANDWTTVTPVTENGHDGETGPWGGPSADLTDQFGRYRIKQKLGEGGMGAVYLVENTELGREEALKVPRLAVAADPEARERFLREARAAAKLDHPNLCQVFDVGVNGDTCYLTMRYLQGKPLAKYTGKAHPPRKAVEISIRLAQALEYAHSKGIIHRDLKPSNIMMCAGVGPVVMDFGLAKQTRQDGPKLTRPGTTLGTPPYMPPEQVRGEVERMCPASDVYSLGTILYQLVTGQVPFEGPVDEVLTQILYTDPPAPSVVLPELGTGLDAICLTALAKAPEDRYASMKAMIAALTDYLKAKPAEDGAPWWVLHAPVPPLSPSTDPVTPATEAASDESSGPAEATPATPSPVSVPPPPRTPPVAPRKATPKAAPPPPPERATPPAAPAEAPATPRPKRPARPVDPPPPLPETSGASEGRDVPPLAIILGVAGVMFMFAVVAGIGWLVLSWLTKSP